MLAAEVHRVVPSLDQSRQHTARASTLRPRNEEAPVSQGLDDRLLSVDDLHNVHARSRDVKRFAPTRARFIEEAASRWLNHAEACWVGQGGMKWGEVVNP